MTIHILYNTMRTTPVRLVEALQARGETVRLVHTTARRRIRAAEGDLVLNWGVVADNERNAVLTTQINQTVLNSAVDGSKGRQLNAMLRAGLPSVLSGAYAEYPDGVLLRRDGLHGGAGIEHLSQPPLEVSSGRFVVKYIPKIAEFRLHVFAGHLISVARKKPEDPAAIAWNHERGTVQHEFRVKFIRAAFKHIGVTACNAVGYDFGAVDVIMDKNGTMYPLEVNSAPALDVDTRITAYVDAILRKKNGDDDGPQEPQEEPTSAEQA